jgi:hypothetical protein
MAEKRYYQFYANVNFRAPRECLALHGQISSSKDAYPPCPKGCRHMIVSFNRKELSFHKDQQQKMRESAQNELKRRELFNSGIELLETSPERALLLLSKSTTYDLYIPEVERLVKEKQSLLHDNPEIRRKLLKLFTRAYSDKFGWRRYERLPESMRISREQYGIRRLQEILE